MVSGDAVDTSTSGSFGFTVDATDRAGNTASDTNDYSIAAPGYSFGGFFAPIDNLPVTNTVKAGRAVPVKWSLVDSNGAYVSDVGSFKSLTSRQVACDSGSVSSPVEETTTAGSSGLRYTLTNQFTYRGRRRKAGPGPAE